MGKGSLVCQIYFLLQDGQVSWCTQHLSYLFWVWLHCVDKSLSMLLLVVNAILTPVFLNNFVMNLVSLPTRLNKLSLVRHESPSNLIFYTRVINKTNIIFTNEELTLLNKGLKYNLNDKHKHWLTNLAFEAETAITLLPIDIQDQVWHQVAHNIDWLYRQQNNQQKHINMQARNERKTINQMRKKLIDNKAMISKADKGNSIIHVIIYIDEYKSKILDFITNNNFTIADNDIPRKLQHDLKLAINECQKRIRKDNSWRYINLNPIAPTLRGLIKIYKEGARIRPFVNWKNTPAYKLAKMLAKKLVSYVPLSYTFNIRNTVQLINDLTDIRYDSSIKFAHLTLPICIPTSLLKNCYKLSI